jgi:hypothetical protein
VLNWVDADLLQMGQQLGCVMQSPGPEKSKGAESKVEDGGIVRSGMFSEVNGPDGFVVFPHELPKGLNEFFCLTWVFLDPEIIQIILKG